MSDQEKNEFDAVPEEKAVPEPGSGPETPEEAEGRTPGEEDPGSPAPAPEESPEGPAPKPAPEGPPPEAAAESVNGISIGMSLCDAVIYAVGPDRFHGGVRPNNISVRDSQVYLGGTLKHGVGEFTPQELEYMAPELFWDGIRSPAADVYSIGLVLYSLYNYGRLPFWPTSGAITPNARASGLQRRMSDEPLVPPERADAELAAVILRALAFRTEERWHDVVELRDALGSCDAANSPVDISLAMSGLLTRNADSRPAEPAGGGGENPHTYHDEGDPSGERRPRPRRNLSWLWILLGLLFLAGAIALLVNDKFSFSGAAPTASPTQAATFTPVPTAEPTPEVTPTASPTARPSGPKYVVYREDVSWSEAVARCQEEGGWLAMPRTETELEDIARLCNNEGLQFAWLGASRQEDESWADTEGELITWFKWSEGEPSMTDGGDGASEDYMLLWRLDDTSWYFNDSREDPVADYPWTYVGQIGFVCQMW